jgi:hypothetical protein
MNNSNNSSRQHALFFQGKPLPLERSLRENLYFWAFFLVALNNQNDAGFSRKNITSKEKLWTPQENAP